MKKFLLALVIVLPMVLAGCVQNKDNDSPKLMSSIKGISIGMTTEEAMDSLKAQGMAVEVSGSGIQFIKVNETIAIGNLVFDKLTAYAYTSGVSNILLSKEFYSLANAENFYNNAYQVFEGKYSAFLSNPNEAQRKAYIESTCWADSVTVLDLFLNHEDEYWEVGLMLSRHQ